MVSPAPAKPLTNAATDKIAPKGADAETAWLVATLIADGLLVLAGLLRIGSPKQVLAMVRRIWANAG